MTPLQHLQLLLRYERTEALQRIIRQVIRPGMRVLDAGCGLGVLAQIAARCGAQVLAVDLDDVSLARSLAAENGLAGQIEFSQGDLHQLIHGRPELRSAFDVIVAMVYLNDPRRDEVQSSLAQFLKEQFLKPGGKAIPTHVKYLACLGQWPAQDHAARQRLIASQVGSIAQRYDLRFDNLQKQIEATAYKDFFPQRLANGRLAKDDFCELTNLQDAWTIDYRSNECRYPDSLSFQWSRAGVPHVVLWTQQIMFEDQTIFSNESISWIRNPHERDGGRQVTIALDQDWRAENCVTLRNGSPNLS